MCILFVGALCWEALLEARESFIEGEYAVGIIRVPLWPAKIGLAIGCGALLLQYFADLIFATKERKRIKH
jgi:hypothetical protein